MDLNNPHFQQTAFLLSPFLLRLGGSLQDHITYDMTNTTTTPNPYAGKLRRRLAGAADYDPSSSSSCPPFTYNEDVKFKFQGGCLTGGRYKEFFDFCHLIGCKVRRTWWWWWWW